MLERYERHVGRSHLDLGIVTGWYLDRCTWPVEQPEITLFDLNENAFLPAARRLARYAPRAVRANVLDPLPLGDARFESAAANYLLHCLPGRSDSKAATLATNVRPYLEPGGVLFGSTILGSGVTHSIGRRLTKVYNAMGIFSNAEDDERGLEQGFAATFATSRSRSWARSRSSRCGLDRATSHACSRDRHALRADSAALLPGRPGGRFCRERPDSNQRPPARLRVVSNRATAVGR